MFTRLAGDVREMVHEQFEYWELLYVMSRRDLTLRYKQTIMGLGWAIYAPAQHDSLLGHLREGREARRNLSGVRLLRPPGLEPDGPACGFP